jgi:glucose/arabinose dehydrogenase
MKLQRVAASCVLAGTASTLAATLPNGFDEIAVTGSITRATAMEFSPDGRLFVLEQDGTIEVYEGFGARPWTQVAPQRNFLHSTPLTVNANGERGLLGIAFDPNFHNNRFVYIYYTATTPTVHNRVSRFKANAAGTRAVAGSETVIMDLDNLSNATNHNGGAIHFGPDSMLYVAVGDNANSANSQSINNRLGKILRLNPDPDDPIPADNPGTIDGIAGSTMGVNRAIWAAGLRNPFTFAFKPGTSTARSRYRKLMMFPSCGWSQFSLIVGTAPRLSRSMLVASIAARQ